MTEVATAAPVVSGTRLDRRQFVFGGVLLAASAAAYALKPRRLIAPIAPGELDAAVPSTIGRFRFATESGLVLPPQDELSERIYDQVLTRLYTDPNGVSIMLLIAYGSAQDSGLQLHRPEVCYPASGYMISHIEQVPVALAGQGRGEATYLTAERGDRIEQVFYWTRIGHVFPATAWDEKMAILKANALGSLPDGVLVRISTIDGNRAASLDQIEAFNDALLKSLGGDGRRLLLGTAGPA